MPRDNYSIEGDNPRSWQANYQGRLSRSEFHEGQVPLKARGSCSWCWYSWRHIQRVWNILICSSGGTNCQPVLVSHCPFWCQASADIFPTLTPPVGPPPLEQGVAPTEAATPWPTSTRQHPQTPRAAGASAPLVRSADRQGSWTDERAGYTALAKAQPGWAGQSKMQLFPSRDSKGEISAPPKEHARARARAPCCHLPSYLPCSPCLSSLPPPAAPPGRHQSFSPILT